MTKKHSIQSIVDTKTKSIVQIGIVVKDAFETAKSFSKIFGTGPWYFFESVPSKATLHGKPMKDGESCVRLGFSSLANLEIELLQPLYGASTHMEFLQSRGEGIHHLSFGEVEDHDAFVSQLKDHGFGIEMDGVSSEVMPFTYMATQDKLGTIFEVLKPITDEEKSKLSPWGVYTPPEQDALVDLEGKKIVRIGIVVEDAEKTARNFWEIFGFGPWTLFDYKLPMATCDRVHGVGTIEGVDVHVRSALAEHNGIQLELLQPIKGPSTHMDFLKRYGQGVHHISFDVVEDHDHIISSLASHGVRIDMAGVVGGAHRYTYLDTRQELATVIECLKVNRGVANSTKPYGTYPSGQ